MKCKGCGRNIPDQSLYCNWCGKYQLKKPKTEITVPKPIQLPSGAWRIQLRKEGISITSDTPDSCKKKALQARKQWLSDEAAGLHEPLPETKTLGQVIDDYISAKKLVLSPSTISGYQSIRDNRFRYHMNDDALSLSPQNIINDEILSGASAKTVTNAWALCQSALKYAEIDTAQPKLPRKIKSERKWLDYNQIQIFLKAVYGQPCELGALLALHSLRRSEIFGLRPSDYDANTQVIHIRGAMLSTIQSGWIRTELNKNDTSRRDIPVLIPRLHELLSAIDKSEDYIIGDTQKNLYRQINRICAENGLPETGLHGLRHSFASLAYHLRWQKMSTMQIGGWKNSKVLDEIYTHNADLEDDLKSMREYFRE